MVKIIDISNDKEKQSFIDNLQKAIQSANLNFLIGSGCSLPAINTLSNVEKEIEELNEKNKEDEAHIKLCDFLKPICKCTENLLNNKKEENLKETCRNYNNFLQSVSNILNKRKSSILPKKAAIFTTNYDLFVEHSSSNLGDSTILNDGFRQNPSINNEFTYSSNSFYQSVFNTGNLYQYKVQIPMINLIKMHGSLNWIIDKSESKNFLEHIIVKNKDLDSFLKEEISVIFDKAYIVLPRKDKFKETILNHIYYDLLRIYSNELDKENTLLIAEGFSFCDEHILSLTQRALKNPTLKLIVFCYEKTGKTFEEIFSSNNNVEIIINSKSNIGFEEFIATLNKVLPDISKKVPDSNNGSKDE